jgi:nucleotide-binding universal stress UspA family protein
MADFGRNRRRVATEPAFSPPGAPPLTILKGRGSASPQTPAKASRAFKENGMYQRILVPVDGSPTSKKGLQEAIALAKVTGGAVRVMHVIDEPFMAIGIDGMAGVAGDLLELLDDAGQQVVAAATASVRAAGIPCESTVSNSLKGRVCDLVVQEAAEWKADLIVIGTHGRRGVNRLMLGSDAEQILRLAPVPVLLVRAHAPAAAG